MWLENFLNLAQPSWQCVSKPRKQFSGFFNIFRTQASRQKSCQRAADHTNKEQRALALINQGNFQEAEDLQRTDRSGNRKSIVYGNLAESRECREDLTSSSNSPQPTTNPNYPEAHNNLGIAPKEKGSKRCTSYNTARTQAQHSRSSLQPRHCPQG